MASRGTPVTDELKELSALASLALEADTDYTLQNKSDHRLFILLHDGAGVPAADSAATIERRHVIEGWDTREVSFSEDEKLFAYYNPGFEGVVSLVEA